MFDCGRKVCYNATRLDLWHKCFWWKHLPAATPSVDPAINSATKTMPTWIATPITNAAKRDKNILINCIISLSVPPPYTARRPQCPPLSRRSGLRPVYMLWMRFDSALLPVCYRGLVYADGFCKPVIRFVVLFLKQRKVFSKCQIIAPFLFLPLLNSRLSGKIEYRKGRCKNA